MQINRVLSQAGFDFWSWIAFTRGYMMRATQC